MVRVALRDSLEERITQNATEQHLHELSYLGKEDEGVGGWRKRMCS